MHRVFAVLLATATFAPSVLAQTASLSGIVRDAETGETLVGATVRAEGTGLGTAAGLNGSFVLRGLPAGTVVVVASYVGYTPSRRETQLTAGAERRLDLVLTPSTGVGEAVVTADLSVSEERPVGVQAVSMDFVRAIPTAFEADLFRAVQLLPGVKAASDFSSALYVRGGSPDQTLVLLDGTTVYNPTHFFGFFSVFNTDAIASADLYKGAYPSQFGGRLGSVVDVRNRDGRTRGGVPDQTTGTLTVGLLASRAGVEGPLPGRRGAYALHVRRSTLEPILAVLRGQLDADGIPDAFSFYDVNAKATLDLSPRDRISATAYAGRDQVVVPFGDDARFDLDYGNRTAALAYRRLVSGTAVADVQLSATRYVSDPVGSVAGTEFRQPNEITELAAQADVDWSLSDRLGLRAGARGGTFRLDYESEFNGDLGTSFSNPATFGSGYVQGRTVAGPWTVTGGLRADAFRNRADDRLDDDAPVPATYVRVAPHLQVERALGRDAVVQFAAGRYHQFLSLVSNEAFSGFDTWLTTGPGVAPQASEQAVVGLKTRLGRAWRLDAEVYGRTLRELFDTRPELSDAAGLDYADLFRFGRGYAYGAEVLLERGLGRVTGLVGYTLGVTRRRYPAEPSFQDYFAPKYDRLHDLSVVANVALGRGWTATAAGTYATGQAFTLPSRRYTVGGLPFETTTLDGLDAPALNNERLPPYHRVDAGVTKRGAWSFADYALQLQVVNVYNRRNLWFETYDFEANPVSVSQVRQLPILPNVSLTLRF